ncbi:hypothetical protein [Paractinoplanes maris]|uniref:hypothetical protein n=1 Tax=Paractinoplanes maris TaxID=1734446 RepID=UPI002021D21D|nr:hypothetical protein [Actinoplanes maris]
MTAVHAELRKLITLPSLRWTAALTWAATLVLALAVRRVAPQEDPIRAALRWTQAGFLVFGVLAATQEYEPGGQIRATLLAVPRRWTLAAAKAVALIVVALALAAPAGSPYLVGVALVGAALGSLLRSSVAGVALGLAIYLVASPAMRARLPGSGPWLPDAGLAAEVWPPGATLTAAAWPLAATLVAAVVLRRRNA